MRLAPFVRFSFRMHATCHVTSVGQKVIVCPSSLLVIIGRFCIYPLRKGTDEMLQFPASSFEIILKFGKLIKICSATIHGLYPRHVTKWLPHLLYSPPLAVIHRIWTCRDEEGRGKSSVLRVLSSGPVNQKSWKFGFPQFVPLHVRSFLPCSLDHWFRCPDYMPRVLAVAVAVVCQADTDLSPSYSAWLGSPSTVLHLLRVHGWQKGTSDHKLNVQ